MKKYLLLSLILAICLTLCACAVNSPAEENSEAPSTSVTTALNGEEATNESVSDEDSKEPAQTEKGGSETTESVTDETETTTVPKETETEKKTVETEDETVDKAEETKPPVTITTSSETETPPTTDKTEITTPAETTVPEETTNDEETTDTEEIVIVRPTAAEVSEKVVQYLNQFRSEQGTAHAIVLPGLTQIAEYRSKQLITNFAHDTLDERKALAYYQYGKYVDMTKHGFDENYNYYTYGGGEAIAKGNWGGTADEIALKIATGFRNSSGHWSYVGGDKYNYIAVGCTYDPSSCSWYCCVLVSIENYG